MCDEFVACRALEISAKEAPAVYIVPFPRIETGVEKRSSLTANDIAWEKADQGKARRWIYRCHVLGTSMVTKDSGCAVSSASIHWS